MLRFVRKWGSVRKWGGASVAEWPFFAVLLTLGSTRPTAPDDAPRNIKEQSTQDARLCSLNIEQLKKLDFY